MNKFLLLIFLLSLGVCSAANADIYDLPKSESVMNKKYGLSDELTFQMGYFPVGAFNKYAGIGGTYTKVFNDVHSWEILNGIYTMELAAGLKKDLIDFYGGKDSDFAILKYLVTTNYVYSPFYSKSILFNSSVVYSQLSFIVGGGLASYTTTTAPAVDVGLIQRFFLGKSSSIKFDFRYYAFFSKEETVRAHIVLMAGYAFGF